MKGFGFLGWLALVGGMILLPYLLVGMRPEFKYIIMFVIAVSIYNFLRNFFGDSVLTIGLTAAFFYYLVWKHFWLFTGIWWLYTLVALGFVSTIGWTYITFSTFLRGGRR